MTWAGLVVRNLLRRPARTSLTAAGVALGVALIVALLSITAGAKKTADQLIHVGRADFGLFQAGASDLTLSRLPEGLADEVARQPGVAATGRIYLYVTNAGLVFGFARGEFPAQRLVITQGRRAAGDEALVGDARARTKHLHAGDTVAVGRRRFHVAGVFHTGDPFTLRSNARHPFSILSYRFDADGLPAQDVLLIENGVLRARTATQRYAQYLEIPATGRPGLAEIAPGPTRMADLLRGEASVYQVIAFSAPNVDAVTGNFGMEIRLGYEIGPDGTRPIRGGSVTGNLFEAMADARFSAETGEFASFAGPRAIRFESIQVAGEDI